MKAIFFYSLILVSGLIFAGSSFNNIYAQKTKKATTTTTTTKQQEVKYTCTMHPKVVMDKPGKCPKCGMKMVEMKDMKKEVKKEGTKVKETTKKVKETTKMKEMPKK
ncbi:heavy metal-binding domain-containing protein [uncultured Bacteroides sp.]|uniref:heavy metal-binding domain-containing protein n=1 Tax=uncultured Bacteroides sp. TaxID=162156 RepID=UPI002AAB8B08|nr:heavy metal-binding domain-containing protein [uncultured Bacteroides sp.]